MPPVASDAGHAGYGSAPRTSYLGAIIIERELNQLGQANEPDAFGTRTAESVPPLGVDPDVAEFKRTTDQLKAGYLVNPGRLPEGSPERRQLEQLHQQMQPMQDRLEDLNARIERLRHPSWLDQMRAVIKGGVPAEIASLREKQATVLKQLRPLDPGRVPSDPDSSKTYPLVTLDPQETIHCLLAG